GSDKHVLKYFSFCVSCLSGVIKFLIDERIKISLMFNKIFLLYHFCSNIPHGPTYVFSHRESVPTLL
ncbi:hypothetical protein L9F63_013885, partial [Diploptera punctata]